MWRQLSWKNLFLVICKILVLFVNTVTAGGKYSHLNCNKLMKSIQMQLSKKEKLFLNQILQIFKTNMSVIAYVFSKLQTAKDVVRKMSRISRFRRLLDKQHGKRPQILLKSARRHLYYNCWSMCKKLNWWKSLVVTCKILGLFLNIIFFTVTI